MPLPLASPPQARITIYDHAKNLLNLDVSSDFGGGMIQYEDTPDGCGAATLQIGRRYEDVFANGWAVARNIVEISSADDVLQTSCASGATKLYVTSKLGYDTVAGHDAGQLWLDDGTTACGRIPVTGVGTDGGGDYVTVGAPLAGGGNPTTLPAYVAGTKIFRRRYAGIIIQRNLPNDKVPRATIRCVGMQRRLAEVVDTFTLTVGNVDMGTAIYDLLSKNAVRWPELTITAGNFPTTGWTSFNGTYDRTLCNRILGDLIAAANSSGDQWRLRLGHDFTPRLYKAYTKSGNTYAYNVTLPQGVAYFEPRNFVNADQDAQQLWNTVEIVGDTDPVTKQPVRAIVQDPTSITTYGQIDAQPITNTACKTVAQCTTFGQAKLNEMATARSNPSFDVSTRNDVVVPSAPMGLPRGDVVLGVHNVTVTRFDATGSVVNMAPDSDLKFANGTGSLWAYAGGMAYAASAGPGGVNAMQCTAPATNAYGYGQTINVKPGDRVVLGGFVTVPGTVTGGTIWWTLHAPDLSLRLTASPQSIGASGRVTPVAYQIPANYAYNTVIVLAQAISVTGTGTITFAQPQLEPGSTASPYVANNGAPNVYGLAASVTTMLDAVSGEMQQQVRFSAVEPDWNADMRQRANALAVAVRQNTQTNAAIDQYCVSSTAFPATGIPTSGLTVNYPSFIALFAAGTAPIIFASGSFTVTASATTWAWLLSNGTWSLQTTPTPVASAILYAIFQADGANIIGQYRKAPVGVVSVFGNNLANFGNHPAPAVSASSLTAGASDNSVHAFVNASVTLTNVPTDGSVSGVIFYMRQHTDASAVLKPVGEWPVAQGAATQTIPAAGSLGFSVGAGETIDVFIAYVGIGSSDYGPRTQIGSAGQIASGFKPATLVVTVPYMARNGAAAAPTVSLVTFTAVASANGLSGGMRIQWTVSNQPTDGSLSRLALYRRVTGSGSNFEKYTDFPAIGLPTPSASQAYDFTASDLTNGQQYDWGVSYEDAQGGETCGSPPAFPALATGLIGTSPLASIVVGTAAGTKMPAGVLAAGPTYNGASCTLGTQVSGPATASQPFTVSFAEWAGTPPDWVDFVTYAIRNHSGGALIGDPVTIIVSSNVVSQTAQLPAGIAAIDIGFAYTDHGNQTTPFTWPSQLGNIAVGAMNPKSNLGAGKTNYVADSGFAHGLSYFKSVGLPALNVVPISGGQVVVESPGANTNVTGALYSQPFTPVANQQYCVSAGMGWTDVGGGGTMFIGIVDVSDYNASGGVGNATPATIYASQAVPVAAGTYISNQTSPLTYTFGASPPASVCFCWWMVSANYGFSMYNPQVEPGPIFTGYIAGLPTSSTTGGGAAKAVATQYTGGATVDSLKPQEVGANKTETRTANDVLYGTGKAVKEFGADVTAGKDLNVLVNRTADKLTYLTGGATVDSLMPAEAAAEKTTGKRLNLLKGSDGTNIVDSRFTGGKPWINPNELIHIDGTKAITQDYVAGGSAFTALAKEAAVGNNVIDNAGPVTLTGPLENTGTPFSRWFLWNNDANVYSAANDTGNKAFAFIWNGSPPSVPANTTRSATIYFMGSPQLSNGYSFPCSPGEAFTIGGEVWAYVASALPAGVTLAQYMFLNFYDAAGTFVGGGQTPTIAPGSFTSLTPTLVIAPANAKYGAVGIYGGTINSNGTASTPPSIQLDYRRVFCRKAPNYDTEVAEGSTYARTPQANFDNLTNRNHIASKVIYDGGPTVLSLKPAEVGAEQTTGKRLNLLKGSDGTNIVDSRFNAGKPWIDFSEGIHANKNLANVADDAGSSRYAVAAIDANRRGLIDPTQSGHIGGALANGSGYLVRTLNDSSLISGNGVYNSVAYQILSRLTAVVGAGPNYAMSFYIDNGTAGNAAQYWLPSNPGSANATVTYGSAGSPIACPSPLTTTTSSDTVWFACSYKPGSTLGNIYTYTGTASTDTLSTTQATGNGWSVWIKKSTATADFTPALKSYIYADGIATFFSSASGGTAVGGSGGGGGGTGKNKYL